MGYGAPKRREGRPCRGDAPMSSSDRHTVITAERSMVDRVPCADPERRARLEADPVAWLKHYMAATFTRPFERPHLEIVAGVMRAHESQGRFVVAAERGIGKSAILWGMILYLAMSGRQRYPVCVPWADKALKRAFRFWKSALCFNDRLGEDYPEFCAPFRHARGVPQRVMTTTWRDTGNPCGAQLTVGEGMIVLPDRLGCIGGSTINGNIRGLNHPQDDGTVLRPSIALLDDVQDRQTAKSPVQVADTCAIIEGDVGGCGDPGRDMPMLMACNCIAPGDVSEHYLAHPEWHALRVPCIEQWPDGWDNPRSRCRELWDQWHERFLSGRGDRTFYRKHRKAMIAGMKLSAPAAFAGAEKCPDAFYGVMRMYFRMGHEAFMAERQQAPVAQQTSSYELTADAIMRRTSGFARLTAPAGSVIVCGCDLNYIGLNWHVIAADTLTTTRRSVAYGVYPGGGRDLVPKGATDEQAAGIFRRALGELARTVLAPMAVQCGDRVERVSDACFDASNGKWQQAVVAACREARYGVRLWPLKAFDHAHYKPKTTDLRAGRGWRIAQWPQLGQVLVVDADWWRESMQRGFLVETTEAGALSLYAPEHRNEHASLAMEIAGERLVEHVVTDKGEYYKWARTPGVANDRSDALVYACALSGVLGIGEQRAQRPRYVETRRCKVQREM